MFPPRSEGARVRDAMKEICKWLLSAFIPQLLQRKLKNTQVISLMSVLVNPVTYLDLELSIYSSNSRFTWHETNGSNIVWTNQTLRLCTKNRKQTTQRLCFSLGLLHSESGTWKEREHFPDQTLRLAFSLAGWSHSHSSSNWLTDVQRASVPHSQLS